MTEKVKKIYDSLDKLQLDNIKIYDLKNTHPLFDYVVIASASNTRKLHAAVPHLRDDLECHIKYEGNNESKWLLIDLKDVIVHVMLNEEREYYGLDFIYHEYEWLN